MRAETGALSVCPDLESRRAKKWGRLLMGGASMQSRMSEWKTTPRLERRKGVPSHVSGAKGQSTRRENFLHRKRMMERWGLNAVGGHDDAVDRGVLKSVSRRRGGEKLKPITRIVPN